LAVLAGFDSLDEFVVLLSYVEFEELVSFGALEGFVAFAELGAFVTFVSFGELVSLGVFPSFPLLEPLSSFESFGSFGEFEPFEELALFVLSELPELSVTVVCVSPPSTSLEPAVSCPLSLSNTPFDDVSLVCAFLLSALEHELRTTATVTHTLNNMYLPKCFLRYLLSFRMYSPYYYY
jgi:hypothetical protein